MNHIQNALSVVRTTSNTDPAYLEACELLIAHRDDLTQRVYINLPGGMEGNSDDRWANVKANSTERCACGNERMIEPASLRSEFKAGETTIVVEGKQGVYLRPIGGDKASAYVKVWIEQGSALAFLDTPFAPVILTPDLFTTKGFPLSVLVEKLPTQSKPPVFVNQSKKSGTTIPIFAILAANEEAKTATIVLDEAIEAFDPNAEETQHAC